MFKLLGKIIKFFIIVIVFFIILGIAIGLDDMDYRKISEIDNSTIKNNLTKVLQDELKWDINDVKNIIIDDTLNQDNFGERWSLYYHGKRYTVVFYKNNEVSSIYGNGKTLYEKHNENIENTNDSEPLVYYIKYNELGDFGKYEEYEGDQEIFYYFPSGTYKIGLVSKNSVLCNLWVDYNKKVKKQNILTGEYYMSYDLKEKLNFTSIDEQYVTITDDVHIWNSNNCNYKLKKID